MSLPESFLRRWSRLKLQQVPKAAPLQAGTPVLPPLEALDFNADFSLFMRRDVDAETRCNALRKLFMTDHYRAMDGLDVYVEDYSRPALLPSAMLPALDHAQALLAVPDDAAAGTPPESPEEA